MGGQAVIANLIHEMPIMAAHPVPYLVIFAWLFGLMREGWKADLKMHKEKAGNA